MTDTCIFCQIARSEIKADLLFHDDVLSAFRDINPVASTHILIIPNRHVESLNQLDAGDEALIGRMFNLARELAGRENVGETGYRLVANTGPNGGQTVSHFHLHLIGGRQMHWPPG
jgi:histidine triad (HIT) family protein